MTEIVLEVVLLLLFQHTFIHHLYKPQNVYDCLIQKSFWCPNCIFSTKNIPITLNNVNLGHQRYIWTMNWHHSRHNIWHQNFLIVNWHDDQNTYYTAIFQQRQMGTSFKSNKEIGSHNNTASRWHMYLDYIWNTRGFRLNCLRLDSQKKALSAQFYTIV